MVGQHFNEVGYSIYNLEVAAIIFFLIEVEERKYVDRIFVSGIQRFKSETLKLCSFFSILSTELCTLYASVAVCTCHLMMLFN